MIEIQTTEPSNKTHKWRLYWFHESDLDASYPADAKTLTGALQANPQLRAAVLPQLPEFAELCQREDEWRRKVGEAQDCAETEARRCDELLAERNRARNETLTALERIEKAESELVAARLEIANLNHALGKAQGEAEGHALVRKGAESELAAERARVRRAAEIVSGWQGRVPYPLRESIRELSELLSFQHPAPPPTHCISCGGSGRAVGSDDCLACDGTGRTVVVSLQPARPKLELWGW